MDVHDLLALALLAAGLWSLARYIRQRVRERSRGLVPVVGCVVYMEQQYLAKGRSRYTPVYQYEYGGQVYQKLHNDSTMLRMIHHGALSPAFQVGRHVPLLVDQNEPDYALVNDYSRHMLLWQGIGFLLIGLFCFG